MNWPRSLERPSAFCLAALLLVLPLGASASTFQQTSAPSSASAQQNSQLQPPAGDSLQTTGAQNSPQQGPVTTQSQTTQTPTSTPLGTAAAPDTRPEGVPASTPSGAAIAPAKQKRVRKFSIRTALVVGAVVAVGIVAGASLASSSRP